MFFFAALRFAGENFKAETSSNFSKGRPNVSISKKKAAKKSGQVLQWDHFQSLWLLGLCFFLGGILAFLVSVSFVYHLLQGCLPGTLGKILRT